MSTLRNNVSEILRCLRPSNEAGASLPSRSSWRIPSTKTLFQYTRDMSLSKLWKRRLNAVTSNVLEFGWVVVIYLMSELIIWGLSRALAPVNLEFFSSIFGMILTFCFMAFAYCCFSGVDDVYQRHIKSKVTTMTFLGTTELTIITGRLHQRPFGLGLSYSSGHAQRKRHPW